MLSFDIGHREIRVVEMKQSVSQQQFVVEAPAVADGLIGDIPETAQLISAALVEHGVKEKSCCFVLPTSSAVIREMKIPKVVQKDILSYVRTQFASIMDVKDQDIIDFIITDKGAEESKALGLLLPRIYLEQCLKVAKEAGLKCQKVDVRTNALRKYLSVEPVLEEQSYIVAHLENGVAEINLFEKEKLFVRVAELSSQVQQGSDNLLKNWATSFNDALVVSSEQDTWVSSLAEQLESIVNFQFSRNRAMPVSHVYIYGHVDTRMKEELGRILMMPVDLLCNMEELPFVTAGASILAANLEQDMSLLDSLKKSTPKQKALYRKYYIFAGIIAVILLVEWAGSMILSYANQRTEGKIEEVETYLTNKDVARDTKQAQDVKKVLKEQKVYNSVLKEYSSAFETTVRFNSQYLGGITGQAQISGVTLEYCNYENGALSITGYAKDSSTAAQFAGNLESNKIATDISFEGYEKSLKDAGGNYKFDITGTIGEEEQNAVK